MTPGDRSLECERLAKTLRGLRARTGLSLAALAGKTGYSKSSWERYLNGKSLPPRQAVEALCGLAGEKPGRPLALWELADAVWSGRSGRPPQSAPPTVRAGLPVAGPASRLKPGDAHAGPDGSAGSAAGGGPDPGSGGAGSVVSGGGPDPGAGGARSRPGGGAGAGAAGGGAAEKTGRGARRPARLRRELVTGVLCGLGAVAVAVPLVIAGTSGARHRQTDGSPATSAAMVPASPGCRDSGCTGKNPESYGCGAVPPPTTLRRQSFPGRTVIKIRYGAACRAVWARIDLGQIGDRVEIRAPHHAPLEAEVKDEYDAKGSLSTPMVAVGRSDSDDVRACLVRHEKRHCFGLDGAGTP